MSMAELLLATLLLPLAFVALTGLLGQRSASAARTTALVGSLLTLAGAAAFAAQYREPMDSVTNLAWLGEAAGPLDIRFHLGLDGVSLWLFCLTALLMPVSYTHLRAHET